MGKIFYNSILKNKSLCDGPGYRDVLFLQGCDIKCKGCHNKATWDITRGHNIEVSELSKKIRALSINKKLTISGGEPLLQKDALIELLEELKDFDLCLYTGHSYKDVPKEILKYLKYIKTGPFIKEQLTTTKPYLGSLNQEFIEVKNENKQ